MQLDLFFLDLRHIPPLCFPIRFPFFPITGIFVALSFFPKGPGYTFFFPPDDGVFFFCVKILLARKRGFFFFHLFPRIYFFFFWPSSRFLPAANAPFFPWSDGHCPSPFVACKAQSFFFSGHHDPCPPPGIPKKMPSPFSWQEGPFPARGY